MNHEHTADALLIAQGLGGVTAGTAAVVSDLDKLGLVDEVLREPLGGAHRDPQVMADSLKEALVRHLDQVSQLSEDTLVQQRYERLRGQGVYRAAN